MIDKYGRTVRVGDRVIVLMRLMLPYDATTEASIGVVRWIEDSGTSHALVSRQPLRPAGCEWEAVVGGDDLAVLARKENVYG